MNEKEYKRRLEQAFIAGFCTSNDLPEEVELVEGSILKTMNHWFEQWYENQDAKK